MIPCPIQLKLINSTLKSWLKNEQGEGGVVKSLSKGGISFKKGKVRKRRQHFSKPKSTIMIEGQKDSEAGETKK